MKYTVILDCEFRYALDAHSRYQVSERFDPTCLDDYRNNARDPCVTPRWPLHEIVTMSWLILCEVDGNLTPIRLETRGLPETGEAEMVKAFLADLGRLGQDMVIITWGGFATDLPSILLAAMTHGLCLPPTMRGLTEPFNRPRSKHVDLMTEIVGGATRVHLAEIAARLRIPAKLTCRPDHVARLMERSKWSLVRSVCEGDVLTTFAVLTRHRRLTSDTAGCFAGDLQLCRFVKDNLEHRPYAQDFDAWRRELEEAAFASASHDYGVLCPQFAE
jgi:hypothetical protein